MLWSVPHLPRRIATSLNTRLRSPETAAAVAEIEGVAAEAAQAIVARVSGAQVSADEARAAVQKVLHA